MIPQSLILQMKNIFEFSPNAVYIKDQDFRFLYINQAGLNDLNLREDEVIHLSDSEMYYSQYAEYYNAHDEEAIRGNVYYQLDPCCTTIGTPLLGLAQKFPLKDESGHTYGILGFTQLLTPKQLMDEALSKKALFENKFKVRANLKSLFPQFQSELSDREMEVIYYFLQGMSRKVTASMLHISERTVIFHLNNIKDKWECSSKQATFNKAVEKGWVKFSTLWNLISQETENNTNE
ncbi:MAG: PAS domain-containing protein [Legionellales bacterium]|nr:PAS domain-containing protein [Legionellales bacterium]